MQSLSKVDLVALQRSKPDLCIEANERSRSGLSCRVAVCAFFSKKCLQFDYIPRLVSLCPIPGCLTLLSCVARPRAFSHCRTPTGGKYLNPGVVPDLCTHSLLSQAGGATLVFLPPTPGSKSRDSQLSIATRERELVRVSVDKNAEEKLVAASTPVVTEVAPMETEETEGQ